MLLILNEFRFEVVLTDPSGMKSNQPQLTSTIVDFYTFKVILDIEFIFSSSFFLPLQNNLQPSIMVFPYSLQPIWVFPPCFSYSCDIKISDRLRSSSSSLSVSQPVCIGIGTFKIVGLLFLILGDSQGVFAPALVGLACSPGMKIATLYLSSKVFQLKAHLKMLDILLLLG